MSEPGQESERGKPGLGADLIIPVLACGLAIYYFVSTADLVWEAKATGVVVGIVLIALCAVQFAKIARDVVAARGDLGLGDLAENTLFNRQRLALVALAVSFVVTLPWVGTTLGLFLVLFASMWVLGVRSIPALLGVSIASAATVHLLLIYLLGSRLPQGILRILFSAAAGG
jgi:hypothetical protein